MGEGMSGCAYGVVEVERGEGGSCWGVKYWPAGDTGLNPPPQGGGVEKIGGGIGGEGYWW